MTTLSSSACTLSAQPRICHLRTSGSRGFTQRRGVFTLRVSHFTLHTVPGSFVESGGLEASGSYQVLVQCGYVHAKTSCLRSVLLTTVRCRICRMHTALYCTPHTLQSSCTLQAARGCRNSRTMTSQAHNPHLQPLDKGMTGLVACKQ